MGVYGIGSGSCPVIGFVICYWRGNSLLTHGGQNVLTRINLNNMDNNVWPTINLMRNIKIQKQTDLKSY